MPLDENDLLDMPICERYNNCNPMFTSQLLEGDAMPPDAPYAAIQNVAALVLAAGRSTRMKSKMPKALHPLLGRPLLRYALEAVTAAGVERSIVVIGHQAETVRAAMGEDHEYVLQEVQQGTGHAVGMADALLADWAGPLLVLPGDAPLITSDQLEILLRHHAETGAAATLLTATLSDPGAYGRIVRDPQTGRVQAIVEARDATPAQRAISEINASIYAFDPAVLFPALRQITPQNAQSEYYLTDVIALLAQQGQIVEAIISPDPEIARGINTRVELMELSQVLRMRIQKTHMLAGVTIVDPLTTHIEADVKIGMDTTIHPFTILSGVTDIGADCEIGPGARVSDSKIGNGVTVHDSYVVASEIGDGTRVGPFANIRPGSTVGKNVKIGDFVELKNATLGDNVSAGHLAYLGDTEIGPRTNIGAGTITCNYDPLQTPSKNKTIIGSDAFVGTHSTLVAPVSVGDGAWTAAGSTITDDVPSDSLGLGRARQVNKDGWVIGKKGHKDDDAH